MTIRLNPTVKNIPLSGIRRFFDLVVSAGPEVISLGVGEPDFSAPWHVREAAIFSLEKGFTSYTENAGLLELRKEIAVYTKNFSGHTYNPNTEILVTNGVSEGMDLAFRALLSSGDTVLVPSPGYVMYAPLITLAGAHVEYYDPLDVSTIHITDTTRGIVLNFPGNPLGNTFTKNDLQHIAKLAEQHDLTIFSDEIYHLLTFVGQHTSMVSMTGLAERTILFDGLSKSHAMTGFRSAWACGPEKAIAAMTKIHQYSALCVSSVSQIAAVEALRRGHTEVQNMKDVFEKRREYCIQRLQKMGVSYKEPDGAFYIFVAVEPDDVRFCEELLKTEKLALVPGSAFGEKGKGHVRMTYASGIEELEEAMNRLERFMRK